MAIGWFGFDVGAAIAQAFRSLGLGLGGGGGGGGGDREPLSPEQAKAAGDLVAAAIAVALAGGSGRTDCATVRMYFSSPTEDEPGIDIDVMLRTCGDGKTAAAAPASGGGGHGALGLYIAGSALLVAAAYVATNWYLLRAKREYRTAVHATRVYYPAAPLQQPPSPPPHDDFDVIAHQADVACP